MNNYDTVIMGGGLSGLTCGIALAQRGQRVAVVAAGPSTLQCSGGSLELLGSVDGQPVIHPLDAAASLPEDHPYRKLGVERLSGLAAAAKQVLADAGIVTHGDSSTNHWRLTPMGVACPAWLTLDDFATLATEDDLRGKRVTLLSIKGYLDQPTLMTASGLRRLGAQTEVREITTAELTALRRSPAALRATGIAKRLVSHTALSHLADEINRLDPGADMTLLPAVLGLNDADAIQELQSMLQQPVSLLATLPPSVPGMRMSMQLCHYFQMLGGTYLQGDAAVDGTFDGKRLARVHTRNLKEDALCARHFVLATGSFMSHGLVADSERVREPVLGLDVDYSGSCGRWSRYGIFNEQPYMRFGVAVDAALHPSRSGAAIPNVWAIGSVLSGHNPLLTGDASGVSLLTAMAAAAAIASGTE